MKICDATFIQSMIPLALQQFVGAAARSLELAGARSFAGVVVATPFIGQLFSRAARRLSVIHNYPIIDELTPSQATSQVACDCVCYVGVIDDILGIREVVRAAELTQCKLLLAGRFATQKLYEEVNVMIADAKWRTSGWSAVAISQTQWLVVSAGWLPCIQFQITSTRCRSKCSNTCPLAGL